MVSFCYAWCGAVLRLLLCLLLLLCLQLLYLLLNCRVKLDYLSI